MLLFLDIDGVMVPAKGWKPTELLNDGFPAFSDRAIHALKSIINQDTTIILTTSHKSNHSIEKWKEIFSNRGIKVTNIRSLEKNVNNQNRREEIRTWFNKNNINEDFLILDDDSSLNELPEYFKANLVLTSPHIGLNESHVQVINRIKSRDREFA